MLAISKHNNYENVNKTREHVAGLKYPQVHDLAIKDMILRVPRILENLVYLFFIHKLLQLHPEAAELIEKVNSFFSG